MPGILLVVVGLGNNAGHWLSSHGNLVFFYNHLVGGLDLYVDALFDLFGLFDGILWAGCGLLVDDCSFLIVLLLVASSVGIDWVVFDQILAVEHIGKRRYS